MKTLLCVLLGLFTASAGLAQQTSDTGAPKRSPEDLEKLVAPIALYPDALVALILPASTVVSDVVLAARFLDDGGQAEALDEQAWDESVKALARYPAVVKWMDENLEWTRELGASFVLQPADVMNTVQRLRTKARAAGLLKDTPEQRVVVRDEKILIVPASTEYIYIPRYEPEILYVDRHYSSFSPLSFSIGLGVGSWLYYDCDWDRRVVWKSRRPHGWHYRPDWRWNHPGHVQVPCDEWRPNAHHWRHDRLHRRHHVHRPIPRVGQPHFDRDSRDFRDHGVGRGTRRHPHWGRNDAQRHDDPGSPLVRRAERRNPDGDSRLDRRRDGRGPGGAYRPRPGRTDVAPSLPPTQVNPPPAEPTTVRRSVSNRFPRPINPPPVESVRREVPDRRIRHEHSRTVIAPVVPAPASAPSVARSDRGRQFHGRSYASSASPRAETRAAPAPQVSAPRPAVSAPVQRESAPAVSTARAPERAAPPPSSTRSTRFGGRPERDR